MADFVPQHAGKAAPAAQSYEQGLGNEDPLTGERKRIESPAIAQHVKVEAIGAVRAKVLCTKR